MTTTKIALDRRRLSASVKALAAIRDKAVILTMAVKYVCEDALLRKIGEDIEENLDLLKNHIRDLESQRVGKSAEDIDLGPQVEAILDISKRLKKGEKTTNDQCVKGELGEELGDRLRELASGITELRGKVEGGNLAYSTSDSLRGVMGTLGYIFHPLVTRFRILIKVLVVLLLVAIGLFTYLFITMETEKDLLEEIDAHRTKIASLETGLAGMNEDLARIREEIGKNSGENLGRDDKARLMELNVRAFRMTEKIEKARAEIILQRKAVADTRKRLEELKHKSFFQKVLRR